MKPIYATLDSYNQYLEETRDTVLQCPQLSEYGLDEGEEFTIENASEVLVSFDADLEGSHLDPVVRTHGSGTVSGSVDKTGIHILLKVRKLSSIVRASLHRMDFDAIGPEMVVLWENNGTTTAPFSGTLAARRILFTEFAGKMTSTLFSHLLEEDLWGVVVTTQQHMDGEVSGFLQETFFT
jgi:hypothetical protein